MKLSERLFALWRLVVLSAHLVAGRRFWLAMLLPLGWPALLAIFMVLGWREQSFVPEDAQTWLIGLPLVVMAIVFGVRVIAGEMDRRTLEIAYTVPGGSYRVWLAKLVAATGILVVAEVLLGLAAFTLFTSYPPAALYGALQGALFYLVVAAGLAALFRSEITGIMGAGAGLLLNAMVISFGAHQVRMSPLWNPAAIPDANAADLFAWTLQNRIGFAILIVAIAAMSFARAERRERLLS